MPVLRVAVLLTCHNRRATTLACLDAVRAQRAEAAVEVYLVDDGSTDGTGEAVREQFPDVQVIPGTGELFWAGGMRLAHRAAGTEHDVVLWLNDDVALHPTALHTLMEVRCRLSACGVLDPIVVGAVDDPQSGLIAYSGVVRPDVSRPTRFEKIEPNGAPQECETFNGNVVLVPRRVCDLIGGIDPAFTHSMADFDFGLRARAHGYRAWVTPVPIGTCPLNSAKSRWRDPSVPWRERMQHAVSVKGLPPREWMEFTRRYAGWRWPLFCLSPYLRAALGRPVKP